MDSTPNIREQATPAAIAAAGPAALTAWEEFLGGEGLRPSSRNLYRQRAAQFLRWLGAQGLDLTQVTPALVASYLDGRSASPHSRMAYRTPLRRLFDCLVARQVISQNPTRTALVSRAVIRSNPAAVPPEEPRAPVSLDELKATVREVDPTLEEDSELFDAGLVLLAGAFLGTKYVMPISRFSGASPRRVAEFARRLRANGVWTTDGRTACRWEDEGGDVAFIIDVLIAAGMVEQRGDDDTLWAAGEQAPPPGE